MLAKSNASSAAIVNAVSVSFMYPHSFTDGYGIKRGVSGQKRTTALHR